MTFGGPTHEATAREIVTGAMGPGGMGLERLYKWEPASGAFPFARPVDRIVGPRPQIVAIVEVHEDDRMDGKLPTPPVPIDKP